jgi:lysophospholipase L1-like esterase
MRHWTSHHAPVDKPKCVAYRSSRMKQTRDWFRIWTLCALLLAGCVTPPGNNAGPVASAAAAPTQPASAAAAPAQTASAAAAPTQTASAAAAPTQPETVGAPSNSAVDATGCCNLPETDDGLPGAGPIQRADWFRKIWVERRTAWASRHEQDNGAVVFLGDSITQGWGDDMGKSFAGLKVANRGISGDTTRGVLIRLKEDVISLHPKVVVLLIGTNDISNAAEPETIASNVSLILAALQAEKPPVSVKLCEVFPSSATKKRPKEKIKKLNQLYAKLVKSNPHVTLVHTWAIFANESGDAKESEFPDLLHPNQVGYEKWAKALRPVLTGLLTSR